MSRPPNFERRMQARYRRKLKSLMRAAKGAEALLFGKSGSEQSAKTKQRALSSIEREMAKVSEIIATFPEPMPPNGDSHFNRLDRHIPVLLLPLRIHTRFVDTDSGLCLWIRLIPDTVHIDAHDELLSGAEFDTAVEFCEKWSTRSADNNRAAFDVLVGALGARRAAWAAAVAHRVQCQGDAREGLIHGGQGAPPRIAGMPDRIDIRGYALEVVPDERPGAPHSEHTREVVKFETSCEPNLDLALFSPLQAPDENDVTEADPELEPDADFASYEDFVASVPDGLRWLIDFDAAVDLGMAVCVQLSKEMGTAFSRIVAIGVGDPGSDPDAANQQARELDELLRGHAYSVGLDLLRVGSATNNDGSEGSIYARDPSTAELFERVTEIYDFADATVESTGVETTDAQWLASALGLTPAALDQSDDSALVQHGPALDLVSGRKHAHRAVCEHLNGALFPATWGYYFRHMLGNDVIPPSGIAFVREHFRRYVFGRGPLPTVRVGQTPYGVLPISCTQSWLGRGEQGDTKLADVLCKLRIDWLNMANAAPRMGASGDPGQDLFDTLSMQPVSNLVVNSPAFSTSTLHIAGKIFGDPGIEAFIAERSASVMQTLGQLDVGDTAETPLGRLLQLDPLHIEATGDPEEIVGVDPVRIVRHFMEAEISELFDSSSDDLTDADRDTLLYRILFRNMQLFYIAHARQMMQEMEQWFQVNFSHFDAGFGGLPGQGPPMIDPWVFIRDQGIVNLDGTPTRLLDLPVSKLPDQLGLGTQFTFGQVIDSQGIDAAASEMSLEEFQTMTDFATPAGSTEMVQEMAAIWGSNDSLSTADVVDAGAADLSQGGPGGFMDEFGAKVDRYGYTPSGDVTGGRGGAGGSRTPDQFPGLGDPIGDPSVGLAGTVGQLGERARIPFKDAVLAEFHAHLHGLLEAMEQAEGVGTRESGEAVPIGSQQMSWVFRESLDLASHRLDSWMTSLATRRLEEMREERPDGLYVGAYGWVENLYRDDPSGAEHPGGYFLAPSPDQTKTAAILRSAHLERELSPDEPTVSVDLSAERVRAGRDLMEGTRNSFSLGHLLGYRFERVLNGTTAAQHIPALRRAFPTSQQQPETDEAVVPAATVDGLDLLNAWQQYKSEQAASESGEPSGPASPGHFTPIQLEIFTDALIASIGTGLNAMEEMADAAADQALFESTLAAVRGAHKTASSFSDAAAGKRVAPVLKGLDTPRAGGRLYFDTILSLDTGDADLSGWPTGKPLPMAFPYLDAWVATQLGTPSELGVMVHYLLNDTAAAKWVSIDHLNLSALELLQLNINSEIAAEGELESLARANVLADNPDIKCIRIDLRDVGTGVDRRSLAQLVPILDSLREVLSTAEGLRPESFNLVKPWDVRPPDYVPAVPDVTLTASGVDLGAMAANAASALDDFWAVHSATQLRRGLTPVVLPDFEGTPILSDAFLLEALRSFQIQEATPVIVEDRRPGSELADPSNLVVNTPDWSDVGDELDRRLAQLGLSWDGPAEPPRPDATPAEGIETGVDEDALTWLPPRSLVEALIRLGDVSGSTTPNEVRGILAFCTKVLHELFKVKFPLVTPFHVEPSSALAQSNIALMSTPGRDEELESWLFQQAQVRPELMPVELLRTLLDNSLALSTSQQPYHVDAPWLGGGGLSEVPAEGRCQVFIGELDLAAGVTGIVLHRFDEQIPVTTQDAGLGFHYDQPSNEPPQTWLLAVPPTPPEEGDTWDVETLFNIVAEAADLARIRLVDPDLMTGYGDVLPAIFMTDEVDRSSVSSKTGAIKTAVANKARVRQAQGTLRSERNS